MAASEPSTVHVAIGNTDNRLTQQEWSEFYGEVDHAIGVFIAPEGGTVHGRWVSQPTSPYQNACWGFTGGVQDVLVERLAEIAAKYRQESIAWTEGRTAFIEGGGS